MRDTGLTRLHIKHRWGFNFSSDQEQNSNAEIIDTGGDILQDFYWEQ